MILIKWFLVRVGQPPRQVVDTGIKTLRKDNYCFKSTIRNEGRIKKNEFGHSSLKFSDLRKTNTNLGVIVPFIRNCARSRSIIYKLERRKAATALFRLSELSWRYDLNNFKVVPETIMRFYDGGTAPHHFLEGAWKRIICEPSCQPFDTLNHFF